MKQINAFVFSLLFAAFAFTANAQISGVEFFDVETSTTETDLWLDPGLALYITNTGSNNLNFVAERTSENLVAGHESYFCWALECYAPSRSVGDTVLFAPGDTIRDFKMYVSPNGQVGTSTVTMNFYDSGKPTSSQTYTFSFTFDETSSRVDVQNTTQLSLAYPNPAQGTTAFDVKANAFSNYKVIGMDGRVLRQATIEDGATQIHLNLSTMSTGHYNVVFSGEQGVQSRRIMVQ